MYSFCAKREIGTRRKLGDTAKLQSSLASKIKKLNIWNPGLTLKDTDHGGVFNFDFSKNGSLLGVACERKSVLLLDPFNRKLVATRTNAHTDCVNCVKFLDDRMFATCSDDTTVALWDTRYLKHKVQTFRGHSNWVKNIEYDSNQGILLTSGFDGCIYTWDINKYCDEECSNRVFHTSGLMRSKLSPDFSKLFISTHEGYIIVIHNLDLTTLGEDLKGFKPNMYRLMQRSGTPLRIGLMYNHLFVQERNRVEFIADWPTGNDANIISSIQVHPQGWCLLSRNTDSTDSTEWTCIHDIQDEPKQAQRGINPWEMEGITPHTSSSFCSSTNTPAFSSLAPSSRPRARNSDSNSGQSQRDDAGGASGHSPETRSERRQDSTGNSGRIHITSVMRNGGDSQETVQRRIGNESSNGDSNSDTEEGSGQEGNTDQRPSVHIIGGSQDPPGQPEEETPPGRVHNSLIQIRRGPRAENGQFSFSISVHTVTGQTINFSQSDLESDDEDSEVRVERNPGNVDSAAPGLDVPSGTPPSFAQQNGDHSNNADSPSPEAGADNGVERERGFSLEFRNNVEDISDDGESDNEEFLDFANIPISDESSVESADQDSNSQPSLRMQLFRALVGGSSAENTRENPRESLVRTRENLRETIRSEGDSDSSNTDRNTMRNSSQQRSETVVADSTTHHANTQSVRTMSDNASPQPPRALDSQPRTNTLMFVLQSNTGERRFMNLSYMDSYTASENEVLQKKIFSNRKRLLGYVEECNVGRGFIKELAFSSDGRLVSSPFGYGLRLFAFDSHCNELCDCVPSSPVKLYEVTCSLAHANCVVATKFSPVHNMVVSGCLDGKIAFHQPIL